MKNETSHFFKNKKIIIGLFLFGLSLLLISIILFDISSCVKWIPELAKSLMSLAFTVIFGGIVKLVFDQYQKTKEREEKIKEFKKSILLRLRKVFDDVDSSRLIMEAHQSASTYRDKMQQNVIPSIVTLFDIKRSLVDSGDWLEKKELNQLRIYLHYMIAYLQALANEYKNDYLPISHKQLLHEKLKEKSKEQFVSELMKSNPKDYFSNQVLLSADVLKKIILPPTWVWDSLLKLKQFNLFIRDNYNSPYRKMFVDFYEGSKKILKDIEITKQPDWYRGYHLDRMEEIDILIKENKTMDGISLVTELVKYLEKESKKAAINL